MNLSTIKFPKDLDSDFLTTLKKRVRHYFKANNISRFGNANMVVKSIFMLSLYTLPYILMIAGIVTNVWLILLMWILMGLGKAGIGLSIMHDANHGAYSKNPTINKWMGASMSILGGSATNWKIQHNVLHHSYTNIDGMDEDINPGMIMRLSPHQKRYKLHRLQHLYCWFLYGIMTLGWLVTKDFKQLNRYKKKDLLKLHNVSYNKTLAKLILSKLGYVFLIIVLPILLLPIPWYLTIAFFLLMHFVCGLLLACVFQSAHVVPSSEYPLPDEEGNLENNWAIHQLLTTSNFSPSSRIFSWFIGGLNYQIEHHLFPNICHVHYKKLSKIVKETAQEFGLPYNSEPNFVKAVWNHARMLRDLGKYDMKDVKIAIH